MTDIADDLDTLDPSNFILQEQRRAQSIAATSVTDNPDNAGRALELGKATGQRPELIYSDLENFETQHKTQLTSDLLRNNQYLSSFATSNPMAAKVANDDWGNLDGLSAQLTKFGSLIKKDNPFLSGVLGKGIEAFNEGFKGEEISRNYKDLYNYVDSPIWKGLVEEVLGPLAVGVDVSERAFNGLVYGLSAAFSEGYRQMGGGEESAKKLTRDLIVLAQVGMSGQAGFHLHPEFQTIAKKTVEVAKVAKPYIEAGKEPPLGIHPDIDAYKIEESKRDLDNLNDAMSEAQKSKLRERSPEMFAEFVRQHGDRTIGIQADAVREMYKNKMPEPEDGKLGFVKDLQEQLDVAETYGGDVQIPLSDWLAYVDPTVARDLKDFIRVRSNGVTKFEAEAIKQQPMVEAYHGSPYDFDAFSLEKVGTGEGAQSYGHGLYFAENPQVAESYVQRLGRGIKGAKIDFTNPEHIATHYLQQKFLGNKTNAIKELESVVRERKDSKDSYWQERIPAYEKAIQILKEDKAPLLDAGSKYKVRIHANKEDLLDWDKPFSEQPPKVQEALRKLIPDIENTHQHLMDLGGKEFYEFIAREITPTELNPDEFGRPQTVRPNIEKASKALHEAGIPGIKYLDQGSRKHLEVKVKFDEEKGSYYVEDDFTAKEYAQGLTKEEAEATAAKIKAELEAKATSNFVIFNDKDIEIISKNGEAIRAVRQAAGIDKVNPIIEGAEVSEVSPQTFAHIKPTELYTAHEKAIEAAVKEELDRIVPREVEVRSAHRIDTPEGEALGLHIQYNNRIPLLLYTLGVEDPIGLARHEAIHHLRQQGFFTKDEWATLAHAAIENDWIAKYQIKEKWGDISSSQKIEEAVAEAFREWRREGHKGVPSEETKVFQKLERIVRAIQRAFAKAFGTETPPTWQELFDRADEGEIGSRTDNKPVMDAAYKPQATPKQGELDVTRMEDKDVFAKAGAIGMTVDQYKRYMDLIERRRAEDAAYELKKVQELERKRQTKEWKANRIEMRSQVAERIKDRPDIQADQFIRDYRLKLDENISSDDVANYFGFHSGEELKASLAQLEADRGKIKPEEYTRKLIDAETDRAMDAKYGNLGENILTDAKDQVLSDTQLDLIHEEVLALAEQTKQQLPIKDELKAQIIKNTKQMEIGGFTSDKLLQAAGKAGREAEMALLKEDPAEAFRHKQRQFIALTMAKEAIKLEKDIEKFEKTAKRMSERNIPSIDQDYTNWVHDILMRVGQPVKRSIQDLQEGIARAPQTTLQEFVDHKEANFREVPVADFLLDENFAKEFEKLTVDEFNAVNDSIKALIHNGRDEQKVIKAGEKADFEAVRDKMVEQLQQFTEKHYDASGKRWLGPLPPRAASKVRTFVVQHLQLESIFNRWDKGDPRGNFNQYIMRELTTAGNYESKLQKDFSRKLRDLDDKADLKEPVKNNLFLDPLNGEPIRMTRKNLRAILLNVGNESNLEKLARGYRVDPELVMDWVRTNAKPEDWKWAKGVGDAFADVKKLADLMYRQLSGIEPESIPIRSVDTGAGRMEGWYYPIIYHPVWEGTSTKLMGPNALEQNNYVRATTPRGYTKARTSYSAPLALDLDMMPNRMGQMLHDIAFRPAVIQTSKFFYDPTFRRAITKHVGAEHTDLLTPYLKDVANSANFKSQGQFAMQQASEFIRQNVIATLIGLNPGTVMKHGPTAFFQSVKEVGAKDFARAMKGLMSINDATGETNWRFAMDTSEELQRRHRNWRETLRGSIEDEFAPATLRQTIMKWGATPVALSDLLSAVPTWLAKYEQVMKETGVHGDAIYEADRAVRRAHGSSVITNRPEIMRGTAGWFTSLYGFFNHIMNRQYEIMWRAGEGLKAAKMGDKAEAMHQAKEVTSGLFYYVIVPAIIEELVTPLASEEHESWGKKAAKGLAYTLSASWVGIRDIASAMLRGTDPTAGLISTTGKALTDVVRDMNRERPFSKEHAGTIIQHGITLMGVGTGMLNAQTGKAARFMYDYATGQTKPKGAWGWMTGLRFGTLKNHSATFEDYTKGKVQK